VDELSRLIASAAAPRPLPPWADEVVDEVFGAPHPVDEEELPEPVPLPPGVSAAVERLLVVPARRRSPRWFAILGVAAMFPVVIVAGLALLRDQGQAPGGVPSRPATIASVPRAPDPRPAGKRVVRPVEPGARTVVLGVRYLRQPDRPTRPRHDPPTFPDEPEPVVDIPDEVPDEVERPAEDLVDAVVATIDDALPDSVDEVPDLLR
jgi:hypothetical protein